MDKQDYRRLITDLRRCNDPMSQGNGCAGCGHKVGGAACISKIMLESADAIETLLNGIEAYRRAAHREWVSVEDDMPKLYPCTKAGTAYSEAVAVLTSEKNVISAVWNGSEWIGDFEFWEAEGETVTHWMDLLPLPEPPEVEK